MEKEKIALLDTDFICKMHIIRKSEQDRLIDQVLALPGYRFYCHEQILIETSRHVHPAHSWLNARIQSGSVTCYSDRTILDELEAFYGSSCCHMYTQYLQNACAAFGRQHFNAYYSTLLSIDPQTVGKEAFLTLLSAADQAVGRQNSLGEIKSYVLLQLLSFLNEAQVYVFCSDDKNARSGIIQFPNVHCISVLSAFLRLKEDMGLSKAQAEPYCQCWIDFCAGAGQTQFRVAGAAYPHDFLKVDCAQVFSDLFEGKLEARQDGNLIYKA